MASLLRLTISPLPDQSMANYGKLVRPIDFLRIHLDLITPIATQISDYLDNIIAISILRIIFETEY